MEHVYQRTIRRIGGRTIITEEEIVYGDHGITIYDHDETYDSLFIPYTQLIEVLTTRKLILECPNDDSKM